MLAVFKGLLCQLVRLESEYCAQGERHAYQRAVPTVSSGSGIHVKLCQPDQKKNSTGS